MSVTTIPNGSPRAAVAGAGTASTSPTDAVNASAGVAARPDAVAAVVGGIATQYWAELIPIPAGPARLWFFVDSDWRVLNGPTGGQLDAVQRAFLGSGSTVRVWYDGVTVVGLVVSG
jgi:hypothetical protein